MTLDVYRESGIAGINTELHQLGDGQVFVVPVEPGCPSIDSLPAPQVPQTGEITVWAHGSDGSITVNAAGVPGGDIMVVGVQTTAQGTAMAGQLTSPPAPSCVSLPTPPPNDGSGSGSGSGTVTGSGGGPA